MVQVADLAVREDIAPVIQTPKLYLSLAEVPPPSPNVGSIGEVLQLDGVSTDKHLKELEYEVKVLTSKSKHLMEENIRLEEITEERQTQKTEMEALQLRLLKMQIAEKDTEANKNKKAARQMAATSGMAIEPEKAGQTPPTIQAQEVPEIQVQNQQRGGGGFRERQSGREGGRFQGGNRSTGQGFQGEGCSICGQLTHWSRECPQNIAPNNGPPCSYPG
ncbi:uncharacterized protein LOC117561981 [Gymnodraco acuticeps]|uniref:Uncharacterized protein LOC117561981 n=1 Tax=Gymnodraco acuticeps TaxID=8218 RepID=A0A6P8WEI1_GYMAC|nr:uncharacterized protein LOC117561981 [Gymnodraco acuticeps]